MHVQDEIRDALVLGQLGVGARQQHAVVGMWPEAGPDFLAVDDPAFAVFEGFEHRASLEAGEVGSRVWLGVQLAPDVVGSEHALHVALLLLLGAVVDEGWADQAEGEAVDGARHVAARHLFGDDGLLHRPCVLAAVGLGPAHADVASLVQRPLPGLLLGQRPQRPRRMFSNPLAHPQTKALILSRIVQVHVDLLVSRMSLVASLKSRVTSRKSYRSSLATCDLRLATRDQRPRRRG